MKFRKVILLISLPVDFEFGGAEGIRTPYLCDANAAFSRVNYGPAVGIIFDG
jgi:hypothetical protein